MALGQQFRVRKVAPTFSMPSCFLCLRGTCKMGSRCVLPLFPSQLCACFISFNPTASGSRSKGVCMHSLLFYTSAGPLSWRWNFRWLWGFSVHVHTCLLLIWCNTCLLSLWRFFCIQLRARYLLSIWNDLFLGQLCCSLHPHRLLTAIFQMNSSLSLT